MLIYSQKGNTRKITSRLESWHREGGVMAYSDPTGSHARAVTKYMKDKMTRKTFLLHNEYDADMIEWLNSKPNVGGYVKELISKDMEKSRK